MDLKDAILMDTPQQLLAEGNDKWKWVPLTRALMSMLLHGTKHLLQIKIKVACPCPVATLGTAKIYWTRGGKKRLLHQTADSQRCRERLLL